MMPIRQMLALAFVSCAWIVLASCTSPSATLPVARAVPDEPTEVAISTPTSAPQDDLAPLSDEFSRAGSLSMWHDHAAAEGWPSQVEQLDVNTTEPGSLYLVPLTSTWFEDYRGVFLYKTITGDFDVVTRVKTTGKQSAVPQRQYSLAGLMVRAPRNVTPTSWTPQHENWLFITTGYGQPDGTMAAGTPQIETKTTTNSRSTLTLKPSATGWLELRVVRLGGTFVMLYRLPDGGWQISSRFVRNDMSATVQVGLNAYTNWESIRTAPSEFNKTVDMHPLFAPDLIVRSDYVRFRRPVVPHTVTTQLGNGKMTNADLISALGDWPRPKKNEGSPSTISNE